MSNSYREVFTATGCERITPANDGSLTGVRAINVATSGTVYVDCNDGTSNEPVYIAAGGAFPIAATRVYATGTTATGITVLY